MNLNFQFSSNKNHFTSYTHIILDQPITPFYYQQVSLKLKCNRKHYKLFTRAFCCELFAKITLFSLMLSELFVERRSRQPNSRVIRKLGKNGLRRQTERKCFSYGILVTIFLKINGTIKGLIQNSWIAVSGEKDK